MIRRRPVAAYRVIDEQELLSGDDLPDAGWDGRSLDWPAGEGLDLASRRAAPGRRAAIAAAVVAAAVAFALGELAAPRHPPAVPQPTAEPAIAVVGAATALASGVRTVRVAAQPVPRATVMAPPHRRRGPHPAALRARPRHPARSRAVRRRRRDGSIRRRVHARELAARPATPTTPATPAAPDPAAEFGFER